jgi:hypothetical protein
VIAARLSVAAEIPFVIRPDEFGTETARE